MKKSVWVVTMMLVGLLAAPAMAWVAPTDDQIAGVLADHTQLNTLVQGANPNQIATVVSRVIAQVNASSLPEASKSQVVALIYTRGFLLAGEGAPQMVDSLAGQVDAKVLPVLAAATAVAVGNTEGAVVDTLVQAAGAGTAAGQAVAEAAQDPASALSADSLALVQQLVIELRGVAAPVIPPPATAALNLVPPIVPLGVTQPPPVADTYINQ